MPCVLPYSSYQNTPPAFRSASLSNPEAAFDVAAWFHQRSVDVHHHIVPCPISCTALTSANGSQCSGYVRLMYIAPCTQGIHDPQRLDATNSPNRLDRLQQSTVQGRHPGCTAFGRVDESGAQQVSLWQVHLNRGQDSCQDLVVVLRPVAQLGAQVALQPIHQEHHLLLVVILRTHRSFKAKVWTSGGPAGPRCCRVSIAGSPVESNSTFERCSDGPS